MEEAFPRSSCPVPLPPNPSSRCLVPGGCFCPGWVGSGLRLGVQSSPAPAGDVPLVPPAPCRTVPSLARVRPGSMMIYLRDV